MTKVSVIIPCYNLGQYLDEAVDSVLASTFQDFEIIIVNDGSTDDFTNKLLADYKKPKTRVIKTENRGLPAARNLAIKEASGEYILPLDADDKIAETYIEKAVKLLDQNSEIGCVSCWMQKFGLNNDLWKVKPFKVYEILIHNKCVVSSIYRKKCWAEVGGYAEDMTIGYQDWNLWISFVEKGFNFQIIEEPLFYYRIRQGSMISNSQKIENKKILMAQIINKHAALYQKNVKEIIIGFLEEEDRQDKCLNQIQSSILWKLSRPIRYLRLKTKGQK